MASRNGAPPPDDSSLVVVLLDTSLHFWNSLSRSASGLQQVLSFLHSVSMVNHLNQLVIIATGSKACEFIYDSADPNQQNSQSIPEALELFVSKDAQALQPCLMSASLSMALCYVQRVLRGHPPLPKPRILCLQGSPDAPHQYIPVMNAIFSAQRSMVPIDACVISEQHSAFLQQAADITGGVYMMPSHPEALIQYLLTVFSVDLHTRQFMQLPRSAGVDFRASCFCHKKTISTGYVCSVCLSIFCEHRKDCSTCGASFASSRKRMGST